MKKEISKLNKRYLPDYKKEFILECDASSIGVSAILYQIGENGDKEMIYPVAKKLNETEKNWGITEKELYAMVFGMAKFRNYLKGKRFKVISDHKALKWLKSREDFGNSKIRRWMEQIMEYDFHVEYKNGYVDHMTRDLEKDK